MTTPNSTSTSPSAQPTPSTRRFSPRLVEQTNRQDTQTKPLKSYFPAFEEVLDFPTEDGIRQLGNHIESQLKLPPTKAFASRGEFIERYYAAVRELREYNGQWRNFVQLVIEANFSNGLREKPSGFTLWKYGKSIRQQYQGLSAHRQRLVTGMLRQAFPDAALNETAEIPLDVLSDNSRLVRFAARDIKLRSIKLACSILNSLAAAAENRHLGVCRWHAPSRQVPGTAAVAEFCWVEHELGFSVGTSVEQQGIREYHVRSATTELWRAITLHTVVGAQALPVESNEVVLPHRVRQLVKAVPAFLRNAPGFLEVVAGDLVHATCIRHVAGSHSRESRTETRKSRARRHAASMRRRAQAAFRDINHFAKGDPALTIGRQVVLTGWLPKV